MTPLSLWLHHLNTSLEQWSYSPKGTFLAAGGATKVRQNSEHKLREERIKWNIPTKEKRNKATHEINAALLLLLPPRAPSHYCSSSSSSEATRASPPPSFPLSFDLELRSDAR